MNRFKQNTKHILHYLWNALKTPLLAILIGLVVGALVIMLSKHNPITIYIEMFSKSFFSSYYLLQTLTRAAPIILCATAICMAWRAECINIGVQGQMVMGGFAGTIFAIYIPGPPILIMLFSIITAMVVGALYAAIPAILEYKFGVSLIICSLMLNYVAGFLTSYLVLKPFKGYSADGLSIQTEMVPEGMRIWNLVPKTTFNASFFIAIAIVILFAVFSKHTVLGYEMRITGLNKEFARFGGVSSLKIIMLSMLFSGAIAGLAGVGEVFGVKGRYLDGMLSTPRYAWTGLMAALMANLHPVGLFFTSIFLAGLQIGGQAIQRSAGVPMEIASIIEASITLCVSAKFTFHLIKSPKGKQRQAERSET